jgi:hypothetical protein
MATDKRLSPTEVLVLLSAAYLHDIGMQDERFAGGDLEIIRADYAEVTAELIYRSIENPAQGFDLSLPHDPALVEAVALVAKGHRKADLMAAEYEPLVYGSETLRLQLLVALLRLGDELDVDYRRVDLEAMKLMAIPLEEQLRWWICYYIGGVRVLDEYITMAYRFPKARPDYRHLIVPLAEKDIRSALNDLEDILRAHSVKVALAKPQVRWMRAMQVMPPELEERAKQDEGVKQARRRQLDTTGPGRQQVRSMQMLREVTKLMAGPLALVLTGERWKSLRGRLLTQASKIPSTTYLDMVLLEQVSAEMSRLNPESRVLLSAHRIAPNSEQLEALRQRTQILAEYLIRIYRLKPGDAIELERLAGPAPAVGTARDEHKESA